MSSATIDHSADFDVGPLSWVQGEIDQALSRGQEALAAFRVAPGDATPLKHARIHVHQAAGAIQMVGLDAVVPFTDEIERGLAALEGADPANTAVAYDAIDRACRRLKVFLARVVQGEPLRALALLPEYEAMQRARGLKVVAASDLFFPDLSVRSPLRLAPDSLPAATPTSHLVRQRRQFQQGLLTWLRGDAAGARAMREAVVGMEALTAQPSLRSFWWTVGALMDAIVAGGLESSFGEKQLAARIDLQIRRVVEGSSKVADRLRREVLYYVAISAPVTPDVREVQQVFRLAELIPSAESMSADVIRLEPLLGAGREQIGAAKDAWLKFTSGRAENLPRLKQTMAAVHGHATEIGNAALTSLTASLAARLESMPALNMPEAVAMEYATGLLLVENAFDSFSSLTPDFPRQVEAMLARLDAVQAHRPIDAAVAAPLLDEMSKRAEERLLLAQVVREIQVNLRRMEQVLDAFFRDHAKRSDLATLAKDSRQVGGALRMLGLDQADRLLGLCQAQIESYAVPDTPVSNDDLELLAESLSSLGFYVEAVEQQRPDRERLIAPLLAKRLGHAPTQTVDDRGESAETAVNALRTQLPEIVADVHRAPADATVRAGLRTKLVDLRDDATLIGDESLAEQANAALKELEGGGAVALTAAVDAIAGGAAAAPAPAISEETQRLLATDENALDAEFVDIYLTEAGEVLDTVAEHRAILGQNPGARESLRTVRRGFHTLKGSGRMVGLTDLGELAFDVEKILNRLLEDERAVTPAVLEMIDVAERSFRIWVTELREHGRVRPDPEALHAAILAIELQLPGGRDAVQPRAPEVAPVAQPRIPTEPLIEVIEVTDLAAVGDDSALPPEVTTADEEYGEEIIEVAPGAPPIPPEQPSALPDAAAPATGPEEIAIGAVTLSAALYRILCDEADAHLATLDAEFEAMQFDPQHGVSGGMVRASHTLCGIHRTGGFPLVAQTAKALEQCLLGLQHGEPPLPDAAAPVLADAIGVLRDLVTRVRTRSAFTRRDEAEATAIQSVLEALRPGAAAGRAAEDAEALAAREAARDEDAVTLAAAEDPLTVAEDIDMAAVAAAEAAGAEVAAAEAAAAEVAAAKAAAAEAAAAEAAAAETAAAAMTVPVSPPPMGVVKPLTGIRIVPPEGDPLAGVRDDVDEQILPIFLDEAAELFPRAGEELRAWRRQPSDESSAIMLRRTLHTFKGSARMAGAMRLGELTHRMESRLHDSDARAEPLPALFELLETDFDHLAFLLDALRRGEVNIELPGTAPAPAAARPSASSRPGVPEAAVPIVSALPPRAAAVPPADRPIVVALSPRASVGAGADAAETESGQRALLRVRADIIDRLVNEAGEVAITRARIDGELRALKANLLELTSSVIRLRTQVREIEIQGESQIQSGLSHVDENAEGFDPLEFDRYTRFQELTRSLAEGVNDVATVQQSLLKNLDDADAALLAQARLSRDIQQQLFAIRTVPFGSLSERLYRILRQTAKELDKRANLEIRGAQVELDRSVLEKLGGPLEHLLRNALDHGVEPRATRAAAGKSETGEITLTVRQVGNEIAIELSDDGAGLDLEQIRAKAVAHGRIADAGATDAQVIECIFLPGFTTATRVTALSGRGIGMDVVRSEIAALGGRVEVATERGRGTTFLLYLPLTLAVAQAVLVRAGGRLWALPAPMVEQVQQVKPEALFDLYVARVVEWQGKRYPFHYLPRLLGDAEHNPESARHNALMLLRAGQNLAAVHVDEIVGNQEVVVKNIGPQLARVAGIAGATVLGTGEIVLMINPVQLAQRTVLPAFDPTAPDHMIAGRMPTAAKAAVARPPLVMIVDDSLTVRKITSRMLNREGFEVITAKDGVEALEMLESEAPDVILLDIEMPRMDGFEFTRMIKRDPRHAHVPIIMITSRTAEKHRALARELGVDLFLGKPFQEQDLLRNLREMLALAP
jgi:chemosensory pili system protein ChpA (sensor histidine kinase/response regulator)